MPAAPSPRSVADTQPDRCAGEQRQRHHLESDADNTVNSLAFSSDGDTIFTGGAFGTIGGQTRNKLAAIDKSTGNATSWDPDLDNTVNALAVTSSDEVLAARRGWRARSSQAGQDRHRRQRHLLDTDSKPGAGAPLAMWGDNLIVGAGSSAFSIFNYGYSDAVVQRPRPYSTRIVSAEQYTTTLDIRDRHSETDPYLQQRDMVLRCLDILRLRVEAWRRTGCRRKPLHLYGDI